MDGERGDRIQQGDPETDLCSVILLDYLNGAGSDQPAYEAIARPAKWGIYGVLVFQGFDECFDPYMWYENDFKVAKSASGTITFQVENFGSNPEVLDIDITAVYEQDEAWVPAELPTVAAGVPVVVG